MSSIPEGWVRLRDGSYAKPKHIGRLVSGQADDQGVDREKDLHDAILKHCKFNGWPVVHSRMDVPQTAGVGTPDFVIAMPGGVTVWVEAKSATGKIKPEQSAWLAMLMRVGHSAHVVRSMQEFLEVVK